MDYPLRISKEDINELPMFHFNGNTHLIESQEQAFNASIKLRRQKIIGFDTETRAAFRKGEHYDVSLIQLATENDAYLFRVNKFSMPRELISLLENSSIVKTGVAIQGDIKAINKLVEFKPQNFIDLADLAQERGIENFGLRALTAIFLGKRLSKKAKISNWEKEYLTPSQIHYAACDAIVGNRIYRKMIKS